MARAERLLAGDQSRIRAGEGVPERLHRLQGGCTPGPGHDCMEGLHVHLSALRCAGEVLRGVPPAPERGGVYIREGRQPACRGADGRGEFSHLGRGPSLPRGAQRLCGALVQQHVDQLHGHDSGRVGEFRDDGCRPRIRGLFPLREGGIVQPPEGECGRPRPSGGVQFALFLPDGLSRF